MKIFSLLAEQPDNPLTRAVKLGYPSLAAAAAFSFVSNLLYMTMPLYTFQIYGRVMSAGSVATLTVLTLGVMAAFILSSVLDHYRSKVLATYGSILDQQVSGHVFRALFEGAVRGNAQMRSQSLRDLDSFRQMLAGQAFGAVFDLPWMPVFMIVLFIIDPLVGVVAVLGAVTLFGLTVMQDRMTRVKLKESSDAALRSYGFTDAALRNSEIVRAMGMMEPLGQRWAAFRRRSMVSAVDAGQIASLLSNSSKFARQGVQILIIAIGAYLVIKGKIHSGLLFANMILAARALQPIERLVGSWDSLLNGTRAYERLMKLFESYTPPQAAMALPRAKGLLSVEGVNYAPPGADRFVLQGIDFRIQPGEMLGIIGPSGAGKSTLARLIMGVWRPNHGAIRLDGADVYAWDRVDFGRNVGYLPQDTELFAGSVRDNIARFRTDVEDGQVIWAAHVAGVHDLILRLPKGYDTDLTEQSHILSVGQRQRIGLARAVLGQPPLIVLDEPNASLDAEGEQALMSALDAMKAGGCTIVVVSHKPNLFRSADKILVLKDGRMQMFGPRDQVLQKFVQPAPLAAAEAKR